MAKKKGSLKTWLVPKLRKLSYQWPSRYQAMVNARIERGLYECAICKKNGLDNKWRSKEISLDHILPVVPETGWDDWSGFIERLFCETEGYQVLCHEHHDQKTALEDTKRKKK